jgi:uncharacterized protein YcfL
MKTLIVIIILGFILMGCSFSTKMQVGGYGAEYTSAISG